MQSPSTASNLRHLLLPHATSSTPVYAITLLVILGTVLLQSVSAGTILLVSRGAPTETGDPAQDRDLELVAFLESLGHTVDTDGMASQYTDGAGSPFAPGNEAKLARLQDADLVLVSRWTDSGTYDEFPSGWNTLETPLILMSGYLVRNTRWHWVTGGAGDAALGETSLAIDDGMQNHPFLAGTNPVFMDTEWSVQIFDWTDSPASPNAPKSVFLPPADTLVAGGEEIARFDGRPALFEIPAGTTLNNGDITTARRIFFPHWGYDAANQGPTGEPGAWQFYLTDGYRRILENIIGSVLVPAAPFQIVGIEKADTGEVTLEWTSRTNAAYKMWASRDMITWLEVEDGIASEGEQTSATHFVGGVPDPAVEPKLFYRIEEE